MLNSGLILDKYVYNSIKAKEYFSFSNQLNLCDELIIDHHSRSQYKSRLGE